MRDYLLNIGKNYFPKEGSGRTELIILLEKYSNFWDFLGVNTRLLCVFSRLGDILKERGRGFRLSRLFTFKLVFCLPRILQNSMCKDFEFLTESQNRQLLKSAWPQAFQYKLRSTSVRALRAGVISENFSGLFMENVTFKELFFFQFLSGFRHSPWYLSNGNFGLRRAVRYSVLGYNLRALDLTSQRSYLL